MLLTAQAGSAPEKGASPRKSGEIQVPEGFTVEKVAGSELVAYPMFGTLDESGRLFLFESTGDVYEDSKDAIKNPRFRINLLEDMDGDGVYDKSTIYADKVGFPQGGVFYKGSLYATSAPDLLKFTDTDGDGVADQREVLLSGWVLNVNANSLVGPVMSPDGWLYMTSAIMGFDVTTQEGERLQGETSRVWRVRPDGSGLEWVAAGGMNNPVELTFTRAGEPIGTMTYFTQPKAGQRDALIYWTEGGVYPRPNDNISRDMLTRTGDLLPVVSKYSRVAPSGITRYSGTVWGEEFEGDLFSAQFNTHRIIRHRLIREGGSFRTEDEPFFWKNDEDFHPTDVLGDADGSMLVVETGGWFIEGCPLSQVSKPELKGSVYRVRKRGTAEVPDPYGNSVAWGKEKPDAFVKLLEDPRPFVRDRAGRALIAAGDQAVPDLVRMLGSSLSVDARCRAVFALYGIGTQDALGGVRGGLDDKSADVVIAAARSAGLARDPLALEKLILLTRSSVPGIQRQSATALGRIGDPGAIPALLAATAENVDRFVEHAIIHALIVINEPGLVEEALASESQNTRRAALVALDQMPGFELSAQQITPFIESRMPDSIRTALWVASLHPDWAGEMSGLIRTRLQGEPLSEEERVMYVDMLASYSANPTIQKFMADEIAVAPPLRKIFFLEAIAKSGLEKFPESWVKALANTLSGTEPQVQSKVVEIIRLRGLTSLDDPLRDLAEDIDVDPSLRLQATGALLESTPSLDSGQFEFVVSQLKLGKEPSVRQLAATVLNQGQLLEKQLLELSTDYLPEADAFTLTRILPSFAGAGNLQIGKALASALMVCPSLDSFDEKTLRNTFSGYPEDLAPIVAELMTKLEQTQTQRLEKLRAIEAEIPKGDLERGRTLYFGKAACSLCHTVGNEGGQLGPDLTSIQKDRSAHDLLEAIVYPSATFVREYETYHIKTNDSEYLGIIKESSPESILLGSSPQTTIRIPRAEVVSTEIKDVSLMPQGIDQLLSSQELADLMAFLLGQDQDPDADENILR